MNYHWKNSSSLNAARLPSDAVRAGNDSDGSQIYVGRALHQGENLPAKVIPSKKVAYICYNGKEITEYNYEILCGQGFTWLPSANGQVPPRAVSSGQTKTGEQLYIGRGSYKGSLTPGKIHPSHQCLYIPYGGDEVSLKNYEVLVEADSWMRSTLNQPVPGQAVVAGRDSDGTTIYVGKAEHNGDVIPAKVIPNKKACYIPYGGKEVTKDHFEILTGTGHKWIRSANGQVPPNAVVGGTTVTGEKLYVGRVKHEGSLTPGKIQPSHQCLYIAYGGKEVSFKDYEILVR